MSKSTIQILILTLVTVITIVGFEAYRKAQEPALPEVVTEQLTPLDSNLPIEFFKELEVKSTNSPTKEILNLPF